MIAGKVVGSVISTRKCENLVGNKFMIVDVLDHMQTSGKQLIAIDKIGAGIESMCWWHRAVRHGLAAA